jgi:PAS domain S-box-containing protein
VPPALESKRYAVAAVLVVAAVLLERLVQSPAGMQFPGLVYAAIVAAAWFSGMGPTIFATTIGFLASWALFADGDAIPRAAHRETLIVFVIATLATAAITLALRRARDHLRALRREQRAAQAIAHDLEREVTSLREQLAAQSDWHATTLRSIGDAVVTADAQLRVQSLNASAEALTGKTSQLAHGAPLRELLKLVDADGAELTDVLADELAAARPVVRERGCRLVRPDGAIRYVSIAAAPISYHDGGHHGAVVTLRDVSQQEEAARTQQRLLDAAREAEHAARSARLELEGAHEKFAAFMSNFPYPAFIQDEQGAFVFVNEAGLSSATWREVAGLRSDPPSARPETISIADADRHYFSIRFPIAIAGRTWLGGIAIDISERTRSQSALSERTADFETLFHNVPAPLWIARDAGGTQVVGNAAASALLGHGNDANAQGAWRFERGGRPLAPGQSPLDVALREARVVPYTGVEIVRDDGSRRQVTLTAAPLLDANGRVRGAVAAGLDISQLKAYEAELELAVQRRDEFLAVLAHELRNPLAPIRNSVQILEKAPHDVERVKRATLAIDRQASRLIRLIDDLLDVARVSQGIVELDVARRSVESLVGAAIDAVNADVERTSHTITVEHEDGSALVMSDPLRTEQILVNLLTNALKYTPPGTRVWVQTRLDADFARFVVRDEGPGIPAAARDQLFRMFARSPDRPARVGGLGVGLAVARQLAKQQGGGLELVPDPPGRGATFVAWLPRAQAVANSMSA